MISPGTMYLLLVFFHWPLLTSTSHSCIAILLISFILFLTSITLDNKDPMASTKIVVA